MTIPTLPAAPSRSNGGTPFALVADAFVAALEPWGVAVQAVGDQAGADAATAAIDAATATAQAGISTTQAGIAQASAATAVNAPGTNATSSTSLTIGTGAKSLTIQTGKDMVVGMTVKIANTASPTNWMAGDITAYDSGTGALNVSVSTTFGSGTASTWTVSLSGVAVGNVDWSKVTGQPTNLAGYGITDALTASYMDSVFIANTASLTLPDITGRRGVMVVAPTNAAAVPAAIATSDGWSVTSSFVAGTMASVAATSTATAHGTWGATVLTPPTISSVTAGTGTLVGTCLLTSTLAVALYRNNTNFDAVAIDLTTGTMGTPVTISARQADTCWLFADTSSSFVAVAMHGAASHTLRAGSVSGTTITLGTAATTADNLLNAIQLASGLYMVVREDFDLQAFSVSGTTVTLGAVVDTGTVFGAVRIIRAADDKALVTYLGTGGASAATRELRARTATVSGTTITLNTDYGTASNTQREASISLLAFASGEFLAIAENAAANTTGDFRGITVAGTVVTFGAVTTRALDKPLGYIPTTFAHRKADPILQHPSGAIILGHLAAGPYAVTASGTTLSFGSTLAIGTTTNFLVSQDGNSTYAVGSAAFYKITVSGNTLSSSWQVAAVPTICASDTVTDEAASYSGTWYAWALPAFHPGGMLTASRWLRAPVNLLALTGDIT